jgi:solute carrier family 50 protein (sugar transporter)
MANIVPVLGTILAVALNLSPIVLFYEFFKGMRELSSIPEMMFVTGVFCSTTNLAYGLLKDDMNLYINSAICDIIQIIYATLYLFLYAQKDFTKWLLYVFIAWNLTLEILYIFADVLKYHLGQEFALQFTGWFNVGMTVINAGAPGQKIIEVFKTGNFMLIPIYTTITQILCSGLWGFYGFADMDFKLIIPNLLGVLLCGIQIFAYFYYYIKNKGVPPELEIKEKKEEKEENEENEENGSSKLINNNKNDASNSEDEDSKKNTEEEEV